MRRLTPRGGLNSFTLIELLTVIAIIAILAGLTLAAYSGVAKSAARARARSEILALSTALESYKNDNGIYPTPGAPQFTDTNSYITFQPNVAGPYEDSSAFLYQQLTGQVHYGDLPPAAGTTKIYATFTRAQLANDDAADSGNSIYLKDPFGNSYGYFPGYTTGTTITPPNNGAGFFDLWSTGGDTTATNTATWINNWNG